MHTIAKQLDELLNQEDGDTIFEEVVVYLYNLPLWKLCCFYFYTFAVGEHGKVHRNCIKWVKFPYTLRYALLKIKLRRFFY